MTPMVEGAISLVSLLSSLSQVILGPRFPRVPDLPSRLFPTVGSGPVYQSHGWGG